LTAVDLGTILSVRNSPFTPKKMDAMTDRTTATGFEKKGPTHAPMQADVPHHFE
jgi:hypothetical protein